MAGIPDHDVWPSVLYMQIDTAVECIREMRPDLHITHVLALAQGEAPPPEAPSPVEEGDIGVRLIVHYMVLNNYLIVINPPPYIG
jgi:hypothetical protein